MPSCFGQLSTWLQRLRPTLSQTQLTLIVAICITVALNAAFWMRVERVFPDSLGQQALFGLAVFALTVFLLEVLGPWRLQRPAAAVLILIAAGAHHFERSFGLLIDREMIRNVFETTFTESRHLMTVETLLALTLTGVVATLLVFWPIMRRVAPLHLLWRWPLGVMVFAAATLGAVYMDYRSFSAALRVHHDLMGAYQPGLSLNSVRRYPPERALFQSACETAQFSACDVAEIVNSYDNSVVETDFVLSRAIDLLSDADAVLPAMIFMSDHGESLGEDGMYLHAAPRFMAPETQLKVPFAMWMRADYQSAMGLDTDCLRAAADQPVSHDNLFHTVMGLLDVQTDVRDPALDLVSACRGRGPQG